MSVVQGIIHYDSHNSKTLYFDSCACYFDSQLQLDWCDLAVENSGKQKKT